MWLIAVIVIGYLIGTISPAYILGKLLRGIDIRQYGSKSAGAMNAFRVLGIWPGIVTLVIDLVKGVLAMLIAYFLIAQAEFNVSLFTGKSFFIICLTGFAAIAGHNWPFYMQFRGGKGAATAGGIMAFLAVLLFLRPTALGIVTMATIAFFGLCILFITGSANLAAFISYPCFIVAALTTFNSSVAIAFSFFTGYSLVVSIVNTVQKGKIDIKLAEKWTEKKREIKPLRKVLRFISLAFPLAYFWLNKNWILALMAVFFVIFLIFDLMKKKRISSLYKRGEPRISGITLYLLAALATVLFFQKELAILALIFAAVGDNFAILIGIPFGRTAIGKKSLQGSIACLASCFGSGLVVMSFLGISLSLVIIGSLAATAAELFSGWYDNLTMAPFAAFVMSLSL